MASNDQANWGIVFEQSPIGIAYVDRDGGWLKTNDSVANILGYSKAELEKRNFQSVTHPEDVDADVEMTKKVLSGDINYYEMIKRYISKNGRIIWARLVVHGIYDENGNFVHFVAHILPLVNGERLRAMSDENSSKQVIGVASFDFKGFLKTNWKWALTVLAAATVAIFNFFVQLQEDRASMKAALERIEQLESIGTN